MTVSTDRRPLFIDEILFELGHFLIFGAMAWFGFQEGDSLLMLFTLAYLAVNVGRLVSHLYRGIDRPAQPWRLQIFANGVALVMSLSLIYLALFRLEEHPALELMVIGAAGFILIGSSSIIARGLRGNP